MRQSKSVRVALLILMIGVAAGARSQPRPSPSQALEAAGDVPVLRCSPRGTTAAVPGDADDCAIWSGSGIATIIGTDKKRKPSPGLHVWDLTGREIQFVPVPRPNNVDVRQGVKLGRKTLDIAVCNARDTREIRVFNSE